MLIYNSKQNLHGADDVRGAGSPATRGAGTAPVSLIGPAAASSAVSSIQTVSNVDLLLPQPDGNKVLNAPEPAIAQKSQSAAKLYASLMTPQAQKAVPAVALDKYLSMLEPVLAADKQKRKQNLDSFLARLRIWPLLNQIFWAATDELDPFIDGKRVRIELVKELVAKAKSMLPPDMGKDDQPRKQLDAIVGQVEAIKQAEVNLMKAQLGKGRSFTLYEKYFTGAAGENAYQTYWVGPIAVNPRVAKVVTKKDKQGKEVTSLEYPVPDIFCSMHQPDMLGKRNFVSYWTLLPHKDGKTLSVDEALQLPPMDLGPYIVDVQEKQQYSTGRNIVLQITQKEGAFFVPTPPKTNLSNPSFVAQLPALADYASYDSYSSNGANTKTGDGDWEETQDTSSDDYEYRQYYSNFVADQVPKTGKNIKNVGWVWYVNVPDRLREILNDQEMRLRGSAHPGLNRYDNYPLGTVALNGPSFSMNQSVSQDIDKALLDNYPLVVKRLSTAEQFYTVGSMVMRGLQLDPEWGGGLFAPSKTPTEVYNVVLPAIKQAHDIARAKIMSEDGEWGLLQKAISTLAGTIANVSYLPPVKLRWVKIKVTQSMSLFNPIVDKQCWDEWRDKVMNPESAAYKNLMSLIKQQDKQAWNGKYASPEAQKKLYDEIIAGVSDAARTDPETAFGKWEYGKGNPPYPLVYPMGTALLNVLKPVGEGAAAALKDLTPAQQAVVSLRAEIKATTLLAMKTSDLAAMSQSLTGDMIATLQELADRLYGCTLVPPPKETKPQDYPKFYQDQMDACAANPAPTSLAGKLAALTAKYVELKGKAESGDKEAASKLTLLLMEIKELKEEMGRLINRRVSRRTRATDNTVGAGGTVDMLNRSIAAIGSTGAKEAQIGETVITVTASDEENAGLSGAAAANQDTNADAQESMGYVAGAGDSLKTVVDLWGLPVSDTTQAQITTNTETAKTIIPDEEEKKPSMLWLLLVAVAAASQK